MSDLHEPPSKTSFDAMMGDLMAVGVYGDPVRDSFEKLPLHSRSSPGHKSRPASPKHRLVVAAWFVAIFAITAAASPYVLN